MDRPKVSVVVPVYNVEKYLDRCMQTLLDQTLKEIEIILVDDVSPDGSPAMCDEYARQDERVKVVHKTENGGLGFARNSGMEVATGEYVAFCDSDDWVDLTMYETLYNICKNEELDAVYSEFNTEYYPGFHVILHPEHTYKGRNEIEELMLDVLGAEPEYDSDVKFQVSSCKALYRLDLIKDKGIRFHSERELISEDLVFNLDFLLQAKKIKTVPLQMYYYWLNPESLTHAYRPNFWERLERFDRYLLGRLNDFSDKSKARLRLQRTILLHLRGAIGQEILYNKDKKESRDIVKTILNVDFVKDLLGSYPMSRLPLRHRVFYRVIATKCIPLMRLMYKLK